MRHPGYLQLVDVLLVDLIQGGEAVAVGGVAPVRPVFLLFARRDGFHRHRFRGADQRFGFKHPAKASRQRHGEHGGDGKSRAFFRRRAGKERPDQGGEEGQHAKGEQTREERPEVPASVADRPDHRSDKRHGVQQNTPAAATENQHRRDNHHHAHQREVQRAADESQFYPQNTDSQTDDEHQSGEKPLQDPGESARRVASCHEISLTTPATSVRTK